ILFVHPPLSQYRIISSFVRGSEYCQKKLQQMFVGNGGKSVKSCKNCRDNAGNSPLTKSLETEVRELKDASYNPDEQFETHEDFIEVVSPFLERHDKHIFNRETQSLKLRVTFSESFVLRSDVSVALCAPNEHRELQIQAASHLRNGIFDCSGYYFHLRRCKERERKTERDLETVQ
ncbi:hypothetical protein V1523DRAFT_418835, partial [Lipomyces doorenjongii]